MSTPKRQTCTDHCSGCGRHFHGLAAFDAHLLRVNEGLNAQGARSYELEHQDGAAAGLEEWTAEGWCELAATEPQHPVTIWRRPQTEAERVRLARMAEKADSGRCSSRSGPKAPQAVF